METARTRMRRRCGILEPENDTGEKSGRQGFYRRTMSGRLIESPWAFVWVVELVMGATLFPKSGPHHFQDVGLHHFQDVGHTNSKTWGHTISKM